MYHSIDTCFYIRLVRLQRCVAVDIRQSVVKKCLFVDYGSFSRRPLVPLLWSRKRPCICSLPRAHHLSDAETRPLDPTMRNSPIYYYPVVGRKCTGAVYDRISIEDMQQNHPHQFTLFILGYSAIQGNHNPRTSAVLQHVPPAATYMEVAGVHGKPYQEYAGDRKMPEQKVADFDPADPKDTLPVPSRFGGYCN